MIQTLTKKKKSFTNVPFDMDSKLLIDSINLPCLWFTVWSHLSIPGFCIDLLLQKKKNKKRVMFRQNKHPDFTHMEGNYTCFVHDRSINSLNNCFDLRSRSLSILSHFTKTCGSRNHDILGDIFNFGQCLKKHCYIRHISSLIKQLSLIINQLYEKTN